MKQIAKACLFSVVFIMSACSVQLNNVTPSEFPYISWKHHPSTTLYTSTYDKLRALESEPAHRFLLEVKPKNVTNVEPLVYYNGTYHNMTNLNLGLWAFESENQCQGSYEYFFKVKYRAGLYGDQSETLGSSTEPLKVEVSNFGKLSWFSPTSGAMGGSINDGSTAGDLDFKSSGPGAMIVRDIKIQNLSASQATINAITLPSEFPDNNRFTIREAPTLPVVLNCGESVTFNVLWNPPNVPAPYSNGRLDVVANNNFWHAVILLKGQPGAF